jgi:hypothetical protein
MELTKQQTLELFLNDSKLSAVKQKYKFTTKYKWYCLSCMKPLYISYKQYSIISIFCDKCYPLFCKKPTIAQYQYMMRLKKNQLALIEGNIDKISDIIT